MTEQRRLKTLYSGIGGVKYTRRFKKKGIISCGCEI